MQVGRKILGAKIEILNCLLVVCTRKWSFKIVLRKLNCSTATKAALDDDKSHNPSLQADNPY